MFSKIGSRIGRTVVAGLVVTTIGLGVLTGGGAAHAQQNNEGEGAWTDCYYAGLVYSDGSVIKMGDGKNYRCSSGVWTSAKVAPPVKNFQVFDNAGAYQLAP